jgi:hypothetical protein
VTGTLNAAAITASGTIQTTTNGRTITLGSAGLGAGLAYLSFSDTPGAVNHAVLGDGSASYFNGVNNLYLRINNATRAHLTSTSFALTGNLTASGTLRVGGGTVVSNILSATATLDFPSIGSNGTETLTITVTGAVAGDSVFLGCPAGLDAGLIFCASVTAADTVTVRMHNSSGGSIDPASATFRATVIRF